MKYRYILGIDPSLASTGIALLQVVDGVIDVVHTDTLKTRSDEPTLNRQLDVLVALAAVCKQHSLQPGNTIVAMEDHGASKIRGKLYERVELVGQIKLILTMQFGFGVYLILPNNMKAFVGTTGREKKAGVRNAALASFGFSGGNEHIRDAYCLCRYLLAYFYGQRLHLRFYPSMRGFLRHLQLSANIPGMAPQTPLTPRKPTTTLPLRPAKASRSTLTKA